MKILENIRITAGDIWMLKEFQAINKIILLQVGVLYTGTIDTPGSFQSRLANIPSQEEIFKRIKNKFIS